MLQRDDLRKALREKGYHELRSAQQSNLRFTLMTDGVHVLVLQEYTDSGGADLYQPIGPPSNLQLTVDRIPVIHKHPQAARRPIVEFLQRSGQAFTPSDLYEQMCAEGIPIRRGSLHTTLRRAVAAGELTHDPTWNTYAASPPSDQP